MKSIKPDNPNRNRRSRQRKPVATVSDQQRQELWITDGREAGTFLLKDIYPADVNAGELLEGDVNGDGKADFQILFQSDPVL